MGKGKEGLYWGSGITPQPGESLLFYLPCFSVGDYLHVKKSNPKKITNSRENSTTVLGYPRFKAGLAIGNSNAAGNDR